jgi:transcriptional regulator with XRE-family HTH domain
MSVRVAEEIRVWMARRRVSGRALAKALGVSDAWVSYRLSGKQPIDLNDLEAIAGVLGVAPVELLPARERRLGQTTPEYFAPTDRPKDTRPSGGPGRSGKTSPPNGAPRVRRSRVTGTPLAVASFAQVR